MTKARTSPPLSDAEEALIQAEIAADPDSPELTDAQIAAGGRAGDMLPQGLFAALTRRGRPRSDNAKVLVTLRLDPAVLDGYRSGGAGWQVRMGDVLAAGLTEGRRQTRSPFKEGARIAEDGTPSGETPPRKRMKKPA